MLVVPATSSSSWMMLGGVSGTGTTSVVVVDVKLSFTPVLSDSCCFCILVLLVVRVVPVPSTPPPSPIIDTDAAVAAATEDAFKDCSTLTSPLNTHLLESVNIIALSEFSHHFKNKSLAGPLSNVAPLANTMVGFDFPSTPILSTLSSSAPTPPPPLAPPNNPGKSRSNSATELNKSTCFKLKGCPLPQSNCEPKFSFIHSNCDFTNSIVLCTILPTQHKLYAEDNLCFSQC
mmetsp:Transcript_5623/g.6314  ORF Transcript_5623/g.6314 Transcript_5623/m.6314 type:complete len:232 (-) Transcript_5623:650-1345(-)